MFMVYSIEKMLHTHIHAYVQDNLEIINNFFVKIIENGPDIDHNVMLFLKCDLLVKYFIHSCKMG